MSYVEFSGALRGFGGAVFLTSSFSFLWCCSFPFLPSQDLIIINMLDSEASSPALFVSPNLQWAGNKITYHDLIRLFVPKS